MERLLGLSSYLGGGLIVAGLIVDFCIYDVDAGTRAVIFDKMKGFLNNYLDL